MVSGDKDEDDADNAILFHPWAQVREDGSAMPLGGRGTGSTSVAFPRRRSNVLYEMAVGGTRPTPTDP